MKCGGHAGLYRDGNGAAFAALQARFAGHCNAIATLGTAAKEAPYAITGVILCAAALYLCAWHALQAAAPGSFATRTPLFLLSMLTGN